MELGRRPMSLQTTDGGYFVSVGCARDQRACLKQKQERNNSAPVVGTVCGYALASSVKCWPGYIIRFMILSDCSLSSPNSWVAKGPPLLKTGSACSRVARCPSKNNPV